MDNKTRKTKVLFVITKSNFGGAQKYVYELSTGLSKDLFDVTVALGGTGILVDKLQSENIRVIILPSLIRDINPLKDFASFIALYKLFRSETPDVVHLNSAKVSGIGAVAARIAHIPKIIFTAHGWAFNEERAEWQKLIIKIFSWITVLFSHKTIAVSNAVRNDANSWPFVQTKIVVIKNGIKEVSFYSREEARSLLFAHANILIDPNAFVIGTIAELHKNKGLSYAVEAFAKMAKENLNAYYFILGGGEEIHALEELLQKHQLRNRLVLLGFTNDAARFLPAFDIFLLPSITEGLALVLLEAGLAKLPVVASRVGGIPEVIEDEKTGLLVPPRNIDAIFSAIVKLTKSPLLCTTLGTSLYKKIKNDFSFDRALFETSNLYEVE